MPGTVPNGNGETEAARMYMDAVQAQLGERVTNLGRRQSDLETEMRSGFRQMETSITSFTNETRSSIAALSTTLAERNKPQWQALSVMLAAIIAIGGLVYWPIREGQTRIDATLSRLGETVVTREEMTWRSQRTAEDRARMEGAVADLRTSMVHRNEWSERNLSRDHEIADIRSSIARDTANLQRQIDQQRGDFSQFSSSLGNGRDVIQNLQTEINRVRDQLAELRARGSGLP
ncbi:hypothetical protein [Tianweitania sediminis]|uniref:Uncharacterized protein n=1 Tax=Tianweitania sediminis TaxID=1502156 RepID=A0A8J7UJ79_9HYPH|nr:hypothetical protein [Tianweitania sediminis]MBP0438404.1 hypothetical protein [Tianweitania sediminis]